MKKYETRIRENIGPELRPRIPFKGGSIEM